MITAVDSNIIIDILEPDKVFGPASSMALLRARLEGPVVACDAVWTEVATSYDDRLQFRLNMELLHVDYNSFSEEASLRAADQWRKFRKEKRDLDQRRRIAADFLIGGHAITQCDRLLTRDGGFFRKYFDGLEVISPE